MKHTQRLQFNKPSTLSASTANGGDSGGGGQNRQSDTLLPGAAASFFVMEDDLPSSVVVNHPDMVRPGGSVTGGSSLRFGGSGRRNSGGSSDSASPRVVTFVRHPDIQEIREDGEEMTPVAMEPLSQRRRSQMPRRNVSIQLNNNVIDEEYAAGDDDGGLYLVAPDPLELEYGSNGGGYRYGSRRDRSLSLPAVHGNFRLLRSALYGDR